MRVLIGCESSGAVRRAFRALGHEAWSNDILPADDDSPFHIQGDVFDAIQSGHWDLGIFHPPCTYLTVAGARWLYHPEDKHLPVSQRRPHPGYPNRAADRLAAVEFVQRLAACKITKKAIENPVGYLSTAWRKPNQIIQPWQYGHGETKATCLWLEGLPLLVPTNIVEGREGRIWKLPPSPDRWKLRSATYEGIAEAMAQQWGGPANQ